MPESIRTVRERAKPHGDSRPEHAGHASFPAASAASTRSCVIAIDSPRGRRLRIEVSGLTVADLVAVTQGWSGEA